MNEVLIILRTAAISFLGIAALSSIIFYKNYSNTNLKWMPLVLFYMFINDLFGIYILGESKKLVYNIASIVTFLYYFKIYYEKLLNQSYRKYLLVGIVIYIISLVVNFYQQDPLTESFYISYVVGGCVVILCTILYFLELLGIKRTFHLKQETFFWLSAGLLLFFVGYLPYKISREDLSISDEILNVMSMIHFIITIVMYACFTLGFKWAKK